MRKKIISCMLAILMLSGGVPSYASDTSVIETPEIKTKTDIEIGQKVSINPLSRASTATDSGTTYISSGLVSVSSYGVSTSTITNNKISTSNYLVIKGVQVNKYSSSDTNTKSNKTKSITGSASITNRKEAYSHTTHTFECTGYKTNVLNTSVTL